MTEGDPDKRYIVKFDQVESPLNHEGKSNYGKIEYRCTRCNSEESKCKNIKERRK